MLRAIVFDGDDTLWQTEQLYDEVRGQVRAIVEQSGFDGEVWEARERLIDVENVAHFGHDTDRFPTSCVQAYDEVCEAGSRTPDAAVRQEIEAIARSVFEREAPVVANAEQVLRSLREMGYILALLTKGDQPLQARRVEQSGLRDLFDRVEIVEEKTPESILAVLSGLGVSPDDAITIGNSVRSDVLPSLAAGVTPVWIDAHVWEYERQHGDYPSDHVIEGKELSDLIRIVEHG
jgi:putative hydrolase of the HAD superfamily